MNKLIFFHVFLPYIKSEAIEWKGLGVAGLKETAIFDKSLRYDNCVRKWHFADVHFILFLNGPPLKYDSYIDFSILESMLKITAGVLCKSNIFHYSTLM